MRSAQQSGGSISLEIGDLCHRGSNESWKFSEGRRVLGFGVMMVSTMSFTIASSLQMKCPALQLRNFPMAGTKTFSKAGVRRFSPIICGEQVTSEGGHTEPPKLEPFSQSRLSRSMRERSFLQKAEDALNEKCMVLEGEDAYECWEALFDYENIKEEAETECTVAEPGERDDACRKLDRLESMVRQSGGVNSLIDNVRMVAKIKEAEKNKQKKSPNEQDWLNAVSPTNEDEKASEHPEFLEDGGFPKTEQELEEEKKALMPESPFSRLLKRFGHHSE